MNSRNQVKFVSSDQEMLTVVRPTRGPVGLVDAQWTQSESPSCGREACPWKKVILPHLGF